MSDTRETSGERAPPSSTSRKKEGGGKKFFMILVAVLLAFGAGAGWQWWEGEQARDELEQVRERSDSLELRLTFQELGNTLATAVIQSSYGNYEPARQAASEFFTRLQQQASDAPGDVRSILAARDETITALSRSEAGSRDLLSRLFIEYRRATGISAPALDPTPPAAEPLEGDPEEGGTGMEADTAGGGGPTGPPGS